MADIITGTPADLTYAHDLVRQAWMVVWAITSAALVVILGWMGLSFIMAEHLGRQHAGWREMVPRLVLGLVAAASSLWWCALVLDVADAVSGFIAFSLNVTPGDMLRSTLSTLMTAVQAGSVGMALLLAVLYLVYGFFVLYVIVQMILRLALIDILLALAPIALGLWILPHTAGWGRQWLRLFMTTVFQQAVQLIALALGFGFLKEFAAIAAFEPVQDLIWKLLDVPGFHLHGDQGAVDARQSRHLRLMALDALLRHEPALVADAGRPGPSGWSLAGPPGGREAWRWERWRPARACRQPRAASARRLRWPPHRAAGETEAKPPGAAASSPATTTTTTKRRGSVRAHQPSKGGGEMCQ